MCGIAGVLARQPSADLDSRLRDMQAKLRHRGPDDAGIWIDSGQEIGLAQTRLAILDLSPLGHQPMWTQDGRYVIVFNGEIYNFGEIRRELLACGRSFRSLSDTEVILEAFRHWGTDCVRKMVGMFAFVIWDSMERTAFLARGPFGIKPLYIWEHEGNIAFASEVRSLLGAQLASPQLCPESLKQYLLYGSVQDPQTLLTGISSLPTGCYMAWSREGSKVERYYDDSFTPRLDFDRPAHLVARDAFLASVSRHFVSDVPVNLFLSGGIDSTAILAAAKTLGFDRLKTFSLSFDETGFNEGDAAARTAKHFGVEHYDQRLREHEAVALSEEYLQAIDLPSVDGYNTFCVSRFAGSEGAKVVLSGLGGDELFGGYPSFQKLPKLRRLHHIFGLAGQPLRQWLGSGIQNLSNSGPVRRAGAYLMSDGSPEAAYWTMRGIFTPREADALVSYYAGKSFNPLDADNNPFLKGGHSGIRGLDRVSYLEATRYMQNQLLRDSDVMSMAHGLELRVPFVDREFVAAIRAIPAVTRLAKGKALLQEAIPEIPAWVSEGPKRGFSFPFEKWLSGRWTGQSLDAERVTGVRLSTWYRRWALITFEHFLTTNQIQGHCLQ